MKLKHKTLNLRVRKVYGEDLCKVYNPQTFRVYGVHSSRLEAKRQKRSLQKKIKPLIESDSDTEIEDVMDYSQCVL